MEFRAEITLYFLRQVLNPAKREGPSLRKRFLEERGKYYYS